MKATIMKIKINNNIISNKFQCNKSLRTWWCLRSNSNSINSSTHNNSKSTNTCNWTILNSKGCNNKIKSISVNNKTIILIIRISNNRCTYPHWIIINHSSKISKILMTRLTIWCSIPWEISWTITLLRGSALAYPRSHFALAHRGSRCFQRIGSHWATSIKRSN